MPNITNPAALNAMVAAELAKPSAGIEAPAPDAPRKGVSKWAQLATLVGHGADAASTIHTLGANPNAVETNPLYGQYPSAGKILGIKGGEAAMQMLMQHVIGKSHPGIANMLGYGTGIATGGIAAHNMSLAKKVNK